MEDSKATFLMVKEYKKAPMDIVLTELINRRRRFSEF
jgi:hypothetical protein